MNNEKFELELVARLRPDKDDVFVRMGADIDNVTARQITAATCGVIDYMLRGLAEHIKSPEERRRFYGMVLDVLAEMKKDREKNI